MAPRVTKKASARKETVQEGYVIVPLCPPCLTSSASVTFGRLDGDGCFQTAMTMPKPNGHGYFLHPTVCSHLCCIALLSCDTQYKRPLTLREFARSQGFPDGYKFCSTESTPAGRLKDVRPEYIQNYFGFPLLILSQYFKQIGNAVPLPLAAALGRSIGAAAAYDWRRRNRREKSVEC